MSNLSTQQLLEKIQQLEDENQQLKSREMEVSSFTEALMENAQKDIHRLIDENTSLKQKRDDMIITCISNASNISKDPSPRSGEICYKEYLQDFIDEISNDNDLLNKLVEELGDEETPEFLEMLLDTLNKEPEYLNSDLLSILDTSIVEIDLEGKPKTVLFNTIVALRNVPNNFHIWEGLIEMLGISSICIKVNKKIYYLAY